MVGSMEYIKLAPKAVKGWRISRAIGLFAALAVSIGLRAAAGLIPVVRDDTWIVTLVLALFLIYKVIGLFVYPAIEYRQWGYYITEDKVDIRHGIYFITNTIIPIIRIQHITVQQGPISRRLGLYDVEISLASQSFTIPCLTKGAADEIAENLKVKLYTRLKTRDFEEGEQKDRTAACREAEHEKNSFGEADRRETGAPENNSLPMKAAGVESEEKL